MVPPTASIGGPGRRAFGAATAPSKSGAGSIVRAGALRVRCETEGGSGRVVAGRGAAGVRGRAGSAGFAATGGGAAGVGGSGSAVASTTGSAATGNVWYAYSCSLGSGSTNPGSTSSALPIRSVGATSLTVSLVSIR